MSLIYVLFIFIYLQFKILRKQKKLIQLKHQCVYYWSVSAGMDGASSINLDCRFNLLHMANFIFFLFLFEFKK